MALAVTRLPNLALVLDAERVLDLDSERRVAASAVEIALRVGAPWPQPGDVLGRFENENGRFKAVATACGVAVVPDEEGDDTRRHVYSCHYCLCRNRWIPRWEPGTCPGCGGALTHDGVAVRDGGVTDEG